MKINLLLITALSLSLINLQVVLADQPVNEVTWTNSRTLHTTDSPHDFRIQSIKAQPYAVSWQMVDNGKFDTEGQPILSVAQTLKHAIVVTVAYDTKATGNVNQLPLTSREATFVFPRDSFQPDELQAIESASDVRQNRALANKLMNLQTSEQTKTVTVPKCESNGDLDNYFDITTRNQTPCQTLSVDASYLVLQMQKRAE